MTKRKKPDPKPTPPAADIAVDKSDFLAHADSPTGSAALDRAVPTPMGKITHVETLAAFGFLKQACPICGTARTVDVCPVDGHHFEVTK